MNWLSKIAQIPLGTQLDKLPNQTLWDMRAQGFELAGSPPSNFHRGSNFFSQLKHKFPKAQFQTTLRQLDQWQKYGPQVSFLVPYNQLNLEEFKKMQNTKTEKGVIIKGYAESSGFDDTLYTLENNKWIPAEKPEWIFGFEDADNLASLIWFNVLSRIDSVLMWRKYTKDPSLLQKLQLIDSHDLTAKDGMDILEEHQFASRYEKEVFMNAYREWWWGQNRTNKKSKEFFENSLDNALEQFNQETRDKPDKYAYNIGMDPNQNGKGKFIDIELVKQAYEMYGDFKVVVRYQDGRMIYPASEIMRLSEAPPDDDQSYKFHNQLNGIRDMFIAS